MDPLQIANILKFTPYRASYCTNKDNEKNIGRLFAFIITFNIVSDENHFFFLTKVGRKDSSFTNNHRHQDFLIIRLNAGKNVNLSILFQSNRYSLKKKQESNEETINSWKMHIMRWPRSQMLFNA